MATQSGITPRSEDYSQWYLDVIREATLADYSPVKGSMVLRPHGFAIWDNLKTDLDRRLKETGHVNAYFPLFIPMSFLSKEAQHVEGFAKECAVVTHHRLRAVGEGDSARVEPDPEAELAEPLIVRPTSETMIWHMYGKWIDSYRDLPVLINQWANVVRWELKTRPFLRTAEFLWQEGHTAHATRHEAVAEAEQMLEVYRSFAEDMLALPMITGVKSENERFAGAEETYTIEAMMQNTWALQSGTSHFLGQNFAKAFDVTYQTEEGHHEHVWATSWGVSTRLIGALIMAHSDDTGLVLPPPVAPIQVVVIPIWRKKDGSDKQVVVDYAQDIVDRLRAAGFRVHIDAREKLKPGAKYYEWERKGVPLRMEIGPRDVEKGAAFCKLRTGGDKFNLDVRDIEESVAQVLKNMHETLLENARTFRDENTHEVDSYDAFKTSLADKGGFYLVPWNADNDAEDAIKEETKATIRCYPFGEQHKAEGRSCFYSGKPATHMALFARAY